ncbi:MAG TPA: endolytic transglycosylase MltG, partial [Bacteroidetes bacterium]|nr:endolytic transglycosylase MltG [Bacteroidota bacterium]
MKNFHYCISKVGFGLYLMWKFIRYYSMRFRFFIFLIIIGIGSYIIIQKVFPSYQPPNLNTLPFQKVLIPKGASLNRVADILHQNGLLSSKEVFIILGKISGKQHKIKAGYLKIPENLHPWHLLNYLIRPQYADVKVTIPEGLTSNKIASILKNTLMIDSTKFMQLINDSAFCHSLGVMANNLEGYIFPETYYIPLGTSEEEILRILTRETLAIFEVDSVKRQLEKLGMTVHEIITLASIIEGEVIVDSERVIVSSVYHNRLKKNWLLQADPTIQYIIPGPPRRILKKDLEIDSPYNTYKYKGLPPGPINNPGKK